jgi:hypothetical protein
MRHADIAPHTHSLPRLGFRKLACFSDAGFAASARSRRDGTVGVTALDFLG